ncbi:hypothetical protein [Colwellia sp. PAMC 21821]|uniref:hypothetical protein n=1 Tax=Colwellia sp. PAMC 21821 TaxID=1816219 RepID=UPI0009BE7DAB|nr:hypothetical protein [Colwellia sp. PAMC 21821]ARD43531.1 hypothetical protein A3Q33_03945 [Colwellia sp. PAMC 21821]
MNRKLAIAAIFLIMLTGCVSSRTALDVGYSNLFRVGDDILEVAWVPKGETDYSNALNSEQSKEILDSCNNEIMNDNEYLTVSKVENLLRNCINDKGYDLLQRISVVSRY